jgi:hypothetical protein
MTNEPQIQELIGLYAMISRMRIRCLPRTIACAENITVAATDAYAAPKRTIPEVQQLMKSGMRIDPRRVNRHRNLPRPRCGRRLCAGSP